MDWKPYLKPEEQDELDDLKAYQARISLKRRQIRQRCEKRAKRPTKETADAS